MKLLDCMAANTKTGVRDQPSSYGSPRAVDPQGGCRETRHRRGKGSLRRHNNPNQTRCKMDCGKYPNHEEMRKASEVITRYLGSNRQPKVIHFMVTDHVPFVVQRVVSKEKGGYHAEPPNLPGTGYIARDSDEEARRVNSALASEFSQPAQ